MQTISENNCMCPYEDRRNFGIFGVIFCNKLLTEQLTSVGSVNLYWTWSMFVLAMCVLQLSNLWAGFKLKNQNSYSPSCIFVIHHLQSFTFIQKICQRPLYCWVDPPNLLRHLNSWVGMKLSKKLTSIWNVRSLVSPE